MINKYSIMNTAAIIKNTRKENSKHTQQEMAELLGLTCRQSYADIENGKSEIAFSHLCKLCNIFECDIGYLLGEYTEKKHIVADVKKVTGLSEEAIESLIALKKIPANHIDILSKIIPNKKFPRILRQIVRYKVSTNKSREAHNEEMTMLSYEHNDVYDDEYCEKLADLDNEQFSNHERQIAILYEMQNDFIDMIKHL